MRVYMYKALETLINYYTYICILCAFQRLCNAKTHLHEY